MDMADGTTNFMDYNGMGGNGIWVILIFLVLLGGRGLGGLGGAGTAIGNDFMYTNLNTAIGQGFTQTTNQNFNIKDALTQGFATVTREQCETNRNIDGVRADLSGAVGSLTNYMNQKFGELSQMFHNYENAQLRDKLAEQSQQLLACQITQNSNNNRAITVEALRPRTPVPAVVVNPMPGCVQPCTTPCTQNFMY